jgi:hypothetical protein
MGGKPVAHQQLTDRNKEQKMGEIETSRIFVATWRNNKKQEQEKRGEMGNKMLRDVTDSLTPQ